MTRSFTPTGLDGYRVREADGFWWLDVMPGHVVSFLYNEATGRHDIPDVMDRAFCIARRSTAKGAVADAHAHARMVRDHLSGAR